MSRDPVSNKDTAYGVEYHSMTRRLYPLKTWLRGVFATWKQPPAFGRLIDGLPQGARVLDAGCGQGRSLKELAVYRPDLELFGVDLAPAGEAEGFTMLTGDVMKLPFPEQHFDFIYCRHVIEHVVDNLGLVKELARVLRPGGKLYLETPDVRNTMSWAPLNFWDDATHLRPYTRITLKRMFELSGLEPLAAARVRDWRLVLLGVFYLPMALAARDPFFASHWLANVTGVFIYGSAARR